ncbi:MAG: hypothetical protein ACREUW_01810 [Burkholderiales bacterium]
MQVTSAGAAAALSLFLTCAHAQVPGGVRALQLQRDQQQSESVLRSQQFQREAQQPAGSPAVTQERALQDQAQRQQQQQLFQQQRMQEAIGNVPPASGGPVRQFQPQQFERERQQQLNQFGAERALQDATAPR